MGIATLSCWTTSWREGAESEDRNFFASACLFHDQIDDSHDSLLGALLFDIGFVRYHFDLRHEGAVCYEGDQTAVWLLTDGTTSPTIGAEAEG